MRRSVVVYAVLFVAAMVGSYVSWTYEPETGAADETIQVADIPRDDIASIRYETDEATLTLETRSDERGLYVWVVEQRHRPEEPESSGDAGATADSAGSPRTEGGATDAGRADTTSSDAGDTQAGDTNARHTKTGRTNKGDAHTADSDGGVTKPGRPVSEGDAADGDSEKPPERLEYKASPAVEELFDHLAPLEAKRRIDVDGAEDRESFGFDDPRAEMTLDLHSGGTRKFTIAGYAFGRRHLYVRDEADGEAYVVDAGFVGPLEFPKSRLREHRLLEQRERDVAEVDLETGDESVRLVHRNRSDPRASYWSVGESDSDDSSASSWVGELLGLRVERFVDEPDGELERILVARVVPTDGEAVEIEVFRTASDQTQWYGRSSYTRSLVRLKASRASRVVDDLDAVLDAGDESETPAGEK